MEFVFFKMKALHQSFSYKIFSSRFESTKADKTRPVLSKKFEYLNANRLQINQAVPNRGSERYN